MCYCMCTSSGDSVEVAGHAKTGAGRAQSAAEQGATTVTGGTTQTEGNSAAGQQAAHQKLQDGAYDKATSGTVSTHGQRYLSSRSPASCYCCTLEMPIPSVVRARLCVCAASRSEHKHTQTLWQLTFVLPWIIRCCSQLTDASLFVFGGCHSLLRWQLPLYRPVINFYHWCSTRRS